jgi:hypothetical protein
MDDIKAGIYGHKVIPLFHWMIFLSCGFHLSDMRRWTNSEFMMVSIYFIKSHFTLKMYDSNTWHKANVHVTLTLQDLKIFKNYLILEWYNKTINDLISVDIKNYAYTSSSKVINLILYKYWLLSRLNAYRLSELIFF